jgi:hypothetical protein
MPGAVGASSPAGTTPIGIPIGSGWRGCCAHRVGLCRRLPICTPIRLPRRTITRARDVSFDGCTEQAIRDLRSGRIRPSTGIRGVSTALGPDRLIIARSWVRSPLAPQTLAGQRKLGAGAGVRQPACPARRGCAGGDAASGLTRRLCQVRTTPTPLPFLFLGSRENSLCQIGQVCTKPLVVLLQSPNLGEKLSFPLSGRVSHRPFRFGSCAAY